MLPVLAGETNTPPPPPPAQPDVVFTDVQWTGEISGEEAVFTLTATAKVKPAKGAKLDLLSGRVALLEVSPHPKWDVTVEDGRFVFAAIRSGAFPVQVKFQAAVTPSNAWRRVHFQVAPGPLQRLVLRGLAADTQFQFPNGARPERSGDEFVSWLPAGGQVQLAWQEAGPEAEGKLFYAVEGLAQVTVSPGLMRQSAWLDCKVLQGELQRLTLLLDGEGEVTRVQGNDVVSWNVSSLAAAKGRRVEVAFNRPQKEAFTLLAQIQTPLGAFPQAFEAPQLRPEGATRFAGHCRVVNDGAVRLEVVQAGGLSQISPEQFPMTETMKSLGLPSGSQVFAYRFAGSAWQLRIQADNILPELGVSQVLTYHFGETELAIDAEIELDVREAPLRELNLQIPRGYAVARLNASGMSDFFVTNSAEGTEEARLRIVYGAPVSGRQVVQLRLERNAPLQDTRWALPRLEVARAKSVRGHLGVTADAGFRLTPALTQGLTDIATAFFPKKVAGLQAAFRLSDPAWQAGLTVERLAQSIQADAFHLFSVGEGIAYGSSVINYAIAGAPVSSFRLELSEEYFNVEFTGKEIRNWQKMDGGYQVQLHTPVSGTYTLLATYERPFKPQGETLTFTGVRPVEAQSEQGHTLVISAFQFQVNPVNVSSNLLVLEPGEVPTEHRLFFDAPVLAAYRYSTRPFNLQLELKPLAQGETVNQVVDRAAFTTRISEVGEVLTDARFFVKSKGATHFRVTLPPDTRLWSASVNGEPVVPVAEGTAQLIPLPQRADPNSLLAIELKLAGRSKTAERLTVTPPAVAAPVLLTEWRLTPDTGRRLTYLRGALTPVNRAGDNSGFAGLWRVLWRGGFETTGLLIALGLVVLALGVWRQASAKGVHRYSLRHLSGLVLGILAAGGTVILWLQVIGAARLETLSMPADLHFLLPVQQAGASTALEVGNVKLDPTFASRLAAAWPALFGVALWLSAWLRWEGGVRTLGVVTGWTCFAWAALRAPNGAPAFLAVTLAFLLLQALMPVFWRAWKVAPRPVPATNDAGGSTAGATAALLLLGCLFGISDRVEAAQPTTPGTVLADSLTQTVRVEEEVAYVEASFRWTAERGDVLPLVAEPAVITGLELPDRAVERLDRLAEGSRLTEVKARKSGTHEIRVRYELRVGQREGYHGITLPVRPALVHQVVLTLAELEADLSVPAAVLVRRDENTTNATVARIVFAPAGEGWIGWKPRARDTRREKTVFYVEAHQLFVPAGGVLEGVHLLQLRPAQGEIRELVAEAPPGVTITDVLASQLVAWRFDPDTRRLRVTFSPAHARPCAVVVRSQLPTGPPPCEPIAGLLTVEGAAGQIGLAGVATGNEVQLDDAQGEGFSPINLEDFPVASLEPLRAQVPGLAVRRAFRYAGQGGILALKVAPVEADVRVESQQTLSLGEDRTVLAVNLVVEITRAGIFRLSFLLPQALDVESISGAALSHWTELKSEDGRVITLHLKGKTEGQQTLAISLSGPGLRAGAGWGVPRLALREASKQRGQLLVVPEQGMRLQVASREGVTQLDPAKSGIRQKGVLAFRLLQDPWQLTLDVEQVDSWIQVTSLQDVTVGEGQLKVTANLHYEIENTGVKALRVHLPAAAESVRFKGDQIADFIQQETTTNTGWREWEVKMHRRILGKYALQIGYQLLTPGQPDQANILGVQAVDANLQRGFVTVRAEGRLQLQVGDAPIGLQPAEWQSIPRPLQADVAAASANLTYRLVEPNFSLPVRLERREAVKLLPARVNQLELTSVVSDDGVMLTQARMELTPGDKRLLNLKLPPKARFWFAFVNRGSVWPWRQQEEILIPLEQQAKKNAATLVEFFYSLPTAAAKGTSLDLAVAGPRFDLPLENIAWRVFLNGRWQVRDWKGTLQLQANQMVPAAALDLESYVRLEAGRQQEQLKTAEQMLSMANSLLLEGDPQQARRAFQMAYGLSQQDNAFNEDARVQLHNLKMQQALLGLNNRQAVVAGDTAAPALQLGGAAAGTSPKYTQEQAKQILDRNSAEDNAVQLRLAERLVQQQDAAVPNPAAIRATIPEQGRLLTFSRSLLVDPWAELKLTVQARAEPAAAAWPRIATLAAVFTALTLVAWMARRRTGGSSSLTAP